MIRAPHGHHGYATIVDPDRPRQQFDTCQCGHCDAIINLKPGAGITVYLIFAGFDERGQTVWRDEAGAFCRLCMRPVCLSCHDLGACLPFEKKLLQMEGQRG